ncbi:unnamed protein product [Arabidopsis lyrata]|uniref:Predicted protein n=1 Tax=Arabidopsis lyrata subsp. lyrata TaxID=81972 RepID=D7LG70_ARALL|nr:predicted protein [Arabidopsis lyrata subsp. lyrata]CAH8263829.1 unnamed protein product [Arabidopsis lyrata]
MSLPPYRHSVASSSSSSCTLFRREISLEIREEFFMSLPIALEDTQVSVPAKLKSNSSCRRQLLLQDLIEEICNERDGDAGSFLPSRRTLQVEIYSNRAR